MIGWINLSVEAFITDCFGRDKWVEIVAAAHTETNWVSSCPYPDKVTYDLVINGANILGVTVVQALEAYGGYFVNYVIKQGYTKLLKCLGSNLGEFLQNLNYLHLHLTLGTPAMVAPAFTCTEVTATSLVLHYFSARPGLWPIVVGVLKGVCKDFFGFEVEVELTASRDAGNSDHEVLLVKYPRQESLANFGCITASAKSSLMGLSNENFYRLFPFHFVLDRECRVLQVGYVLAKLYPDMAGQLLSETFRLRHPYVDLDYDKLSAAAHSVFLFSATKNSMEIKGQLCPMVLPPDQPGGAERDIILFMGAPRVANLDEMNSMDLFLSDIPLHDMARDFVMLAEQRQAEADLKERFEKLTLELKTAYDRLESAAIELNNEKDRSEALLYRMLPADIANDLRNGKRVEPINYDEVTILFSDIVGFTVTSSKCTAGEIYDLLDTLYNRFDALTDEFPDVYKLETIGDAYMIVCNLTSECDNHVDQVIDFAIRMQEEAREIKTAVGEPVQIRIGIHTGPVVGGVMGAKTPKFTILGDAVNTASRMESHGLPGKIHISAASYQHIDKKAKYATKERGSIQVKGKGLMQTYLIGGITDTWLLRGNSFDSHIDRTYRETRERGAGPNLGGVAGMRDTSFVVVSSGKSDPRLDALRIQAGLGIVSNRNMDRITEETTVDPVAGAHAHASATSDGDVNSSSSLGSSAQTITPQASNTTIHTSSGLLGSVPGSGRAPSQAKQVYARRGGSSFIEKDSFSGSPAAASPMASVSSAGELVAIAQGIGHAPGGSHPGHHSRLLSTITASVAAANNSSGGVANTITMVQGDQVEELPLAEESMAAPGFRAESKISLDISKGRTAPGGPAATPAVHARVNPAADDDKVSAAAAAVTASALDSGGPVSSVNPSYATDTAPFRSTEFAASQGPVGAGIGSASNPTVARSERTSANSVHGLQVGNCMKMDAEAMDVPEGKSNSSSMIAGRDKEGAKSPTSNLASKLKKLFRSKDK